MCLLDDDDPEMRAEELLLLAAEAAAAVPTTTTTTTEQPQPEQQPQIPLPSPLHVPPAPDGTILDEAASRGRWLVGLLVVQSLSSVVLERFEPLIREHLAITLFLTMLVGAGGNAGNQSAIKVVRSLATGQLDASWPSARAALVRQAGVAVVLGGGLAAAGYVRVIAAAATGGLGSGDGDASSTALLWASASRDAAAIAVSLMAIVVASVMLGTALPFLLARCGLDAAHSGTTIQVASDVLGVLVTCLACSFFYSGALDGVTDGIGAALAWVF
jgi:Mg/Co/Ni transporter MgtE